AAVRRMHRGAVVGRNVEAAMEVMTRAARIVWFEGIGGTSEALGDDAIDRPLPFSGRPRPEALVDERRDLRLERRPLGFHIRQHLLEAGLDGGDLLPAGCPLVADRQPLGLLVLE